MPVPIAAVRGHWTQASGGITTLIYDTFTDTDTTVINSHTIAPTNTPSASWSATIALYETPPNITIVSNQATIIPGAGATGGGSVANAGTANVVITAVVTTFSGAGYGFNGLIGRYNNASSYWAFDCVPGTNTIRILENGSTTRASASKVIAVNTAYNFTVTMNGNDLTLDVDGTSCNYTSASNNDKTSHGIVIISMLDSHQPGLITFG